MNQKIDKVFDELDKLIDDCCAIIAKTSKKKAVTKNRTFRRKAFVKKGLDLSLWRSLAGSSNKV